MKNIEQQFGAILPPDAEKSQPRPSEQVETPRRAEEPYILIGEKSVSYLGVEVPKGQGGRLTPTETEFKEEYFYMEGHHIMMREVATALLMNKPILLEGGTGVYNKTTTIAKMCKDLNMNYCKVNFDRETAREDVIGGQTLKVDENGKEKLEWYDGDLMYAIRNGGVAFLDEYNRQSKIAGIINPIMDAILNGRKEISNPYNENERVRVHPDFRLVAAQNPPGFEEGHEYTDRSQLPAETFGRWIFHKLPIEYTEAEENKLLAGVIGEKVGIDLAKTEFRQSGEGLPVKELAEIPGMTHWRKEIITIIRLLEAKSSGAKREMAKGQRQNLYFNPRMIMSTIPQYIARFYNGDINETVKNAFETCVIGMYSNEEDKKKIRLILDTASWKPDIETKRRGLPDADDKTTPENKENSLKSKAEKEIADLLASSEIPDSVKDALSTKETMLSPDILEQMKEAKEIMGKDFIGPEEAKAVYGIEPGVIPAIPFSKTELEKAHELGQVLIFRLPITMAQINESLKGKLKDDEKLLRSFDESTGKLEDGCWYKDEAFYNEEMSKAGWALVSKKVIPDSISSDGKDYWQQTKALVQYTKDKVFSGSTMPAEYQEAIDEFNKYADKFAGKDDDEINALLGSEDWQKYAKEFSNLKINQLTRHSAAEALYDIATYYKINGERLLESTYTWTNSLASDGNLVDVGRFDAVGAYVHRGGPADRYGHLGASSSRKS
jgi:MoxR-like ATPase